MKLKLIHTMAGPEATHVAGSVIDVSDALAAELIKGGHATKHVEHAKKEEKAAAKPEEKASAAPKAEEKPEDAPEAKPKAEKPKK